MNDPIYLDHAATSPLRQEVAEVMVPIMVDTFGNPSSVHQFGRASRHVLDDARHVIAKSIGAKDQEIIFTSGGTESDNLAVIGAALANKHQGNHVITTEIEHHAVLHACHYLEKNGFEVTYLPVNENGEVSLIDLQAALKEETILVSIMYGNNEVGTIQPIADFGAFLNEKGILFHTDAVQAFGLLPVDVTHLHVDMLSTSAHKINGPKGVGFLYVREGVRLSPLLYGGEQERKRRAGTENVASIAGFQKAIELSKIDLEQKISQFEQWKTMMLTIFSESGISFYVNAAKSKTLPHILNVSFPGASVESMLVNLDLAGIAASSGSACTAGAIEPSHVLVAMHGKSSDRISSSVRFSFGLGNTDEQIKRAAEETVKIVKRLVK